MRKYAWIVGLVAVQAMIFTVACFSSDLPRADNLPPVITGFSVNGVAEEFIVGREGQRLNITVRAYDPNGDTLGPGSISWTATGTGFGTVIETAHVIDPDRRDEAGYDDGASITVEIPAVIWQVPTQDVTLVVTVTIDDGTNEPTSQSFEIAVLPPCPPDNIPPEVTTIVSDPGQITLGDTTRIVVDAWDPDNSDPTVSNLSYEWVPPFGYIEGVGSVVDWVSTDVCCTDTYQVQVIVSDGCDTTWAAVGVDVDV